MVMVVGVFLGVVAVHVITMVVLISVAMMPGVPGMFDGIGHRRHGGKRRLEGQQQGEKDEKNAAHGADYIREQTQSANSKRAPMILAAGMPLRPPGLEMRWRLGCMANQDITL